MPEGLKATESVWLDSEGNPCDFGAFCAEHFPTDLKVQNVSASQKLEFEKGIILFGSKMMVSFVFVCENDSIFDRARIKVDKSICPISSGSFEYAFSPMQYKGVPFYLYSTATTTKANLGWINYYGPFHYVAYMYKEKKEEMADNLSYLLEAFYHYSVSLEAYLESLKT